MFSLIYLLNASGNFFVPLIIEKQYKILSFDRNFYGPQHLNFWENQVKIFMYFFRFTGKPKFVKFIRLFCSSVWNFREQSDDRRKPNYFCLFCQSQARNTLPIPTHTNRFVPTWNISSYCKLSYCLCKIITSGPQRVRYMANVTQIGYT